MKRKTIYFFIVLILLSCAAVVCALLIGPAELTLRRIIKILLSLFSNLGSYQADTEALILIQIRLPRVLLAFAVGAGLACVGAVYQGLLGNPLADPYILGSSSGAALGASCAMVIGWGGMLLLPMSAFTGSCVALILVYLLARTGTKLPLQTLLLSGVVVNAFLFALVMFLLSCAGKDSGHILMWLLGTLSSATPMLSVLTAGVVCAGTLLLALHAWEINLISLGEEKAVQLGVNIEKTKTVLLCITSCIVGVVVSASGLIGFVGLIVPHIVRLIIGPDQRTLIPASFFTGGIFLVICDTISKSIIQPQELPVGVITALCGAPFFLYLLKTTGKQNA